MILVVGGVCQGKLDFALTELHIPKDKIYTDFCSVLKDEIQKLQNIDYASAAEISDRLVTEVLNGNYTAVICDEIGCGIVPMSKTDRVWREAAGRAQCKIAKHCSDVWRVHCGIGMKIK